MAERVFTNIQLGEQGTLAAPSTAVSAAVQFPGAVATWPQLERSSQYPEEDYGRNAKNAPGRGSHGTRGVSLGLSGECRFADFPYLLEMSHAGDIVATGSGPYTYAYNLESGAPTIQPYTIELGSEASQDQWQISGAIIDELTLGFEDLSASGYHPWTYDASILGLDRASAALTGSLSPLAAGMETMQGHYTTISEGAVGTAFASLSALSASLIGFQIVTRRSIVRRFYGGTSDIASGYGFEGKTTGEVTAKIKVGSTSKTDFLDIYNVAGSVMSERRWRIDVDGSGNHDAKLDLRIGILNVEPDERSGEGVYRVEGELVYDATLASTALWTVINNVSALV